MKRIAFLGKLGLLAAAPLLPAIAEAKKEDKLITIENIQAEGWKPYGDGWPLREGHLFGHFHKGEHELLTSIHQRVVEKGVEVFAVDVAIYAKQDKKEVFQKPAVSYECMRDTKWPKMSLIENLFKILPK